MSTTPTIGYSLLLWKAGQAAVTLISKHRHQADPDHCPDSMWQSGVCNPSVRMPRDG